jgi:hypothetical protein
MLDARCWMLDTGCSVRKVFIKSDPEYPEIQLLEVVSKPYIMFEGKARVCEKAERTR